MKLERAVAAMHACQTPALYEAALWKVPVTRPVRPSHDELSPDSSKAASPVGLRVITLMMPKQAFIATVENGPRTISILQ